MVLNPLVKDIQRTVCRTTLPRTFRTFGYFLLRKHLCILRERQGTHRQRHNKWHTKEHCDGRIPSPDGRVWDVKW